MTDKDALILVDGSAYLYRAFHALPPLTTAGGEPTGAIHGVLNMLRKLLAEARTSRVAVVFDAPGKTFRDELYEEYKSHRPPMPDELRSQVGALLEAIEASGLPVLRVSGVEADDVIGTLATAAAAAGLPTTIVTGDKDMAQLVGDFVQLLDTMPRGPGRTPTPLDRTGVIDKFGVRPEQIIDYLALVGDASDNIPGVPGVGKKTAVGMLGAYEDVDAMLADPEGLAGIAVRGAKTLPQKLADNREALMLSRDLATIRCDIKLEKGLDDLHMQAPDVPRLLSLYERLELRNLARQLQESQAVSGPDATDEEPLDETAPAGEYEVVFDEESFDRWVERLSACDLVAFDTETTSLDYMEAEIVGLSFACETGKAAYVPVAHDYPGAPDQLSRDFVLGRLKPWLENPAASKVGHHLKYDAHVLLNHGIHLAGIAYDSMLESYVLNSTATRHDMDSVARKYLGVETIHYEDVAGKGAKQLSFNEVPLEQAGPYAAEDADITLRLHEKLWPALRETGQLADVYSGIEQPLVPVLTRMEHRGVRIDTGLLAALSSEFSTKMLQLEEEAYEAAGTKFNLGSPKQLQEILFEVQGLPVIRKTPKGQPSTAEDVLQELADEYPLPRIILDYRGLAKLKSTYTDKLPGQVNARTGRVHTSYHQAVAATGRLSSSDPNLQNIPIRNAEGRRIRQAFVPPEGSVLLAADYSQIELRIMAHISGDEGLLRAFAEDRDIHQATAAEVFGLEPDSVSTDQRRSAKAINFGLIYGMSAFGLARQLNISRAEAQSYVELYFERYPGVRDYMDRTREQAREQGYVETVFGRRLYLPEIRARQAQRRQYAERSAINAPMQGTAADIIKRAMLAVDDWLLEEDTGAFLVMQVHDELVLEVPQSAADEITTKVVNLMESAAELGVALKVDTGIGANWDEAH
jgi:DNA polymerase-1